MEGDAWVELCNLRLDGGGDVSCDWNVVKDHPNQLNHFLEFGGRWEDGADRLLKLLSRIVKIVRDGGQYSDELFVVGRGEHDLCNQGLWTCHVDGVVAEKGGDIVGDGYAIPTDDESCAARWACS